MSIIVTPLSEAIGAEIVGVDLSLPVSDNDLQIINSTIEKYLIMIDTYVVGSHSSAG